MRVGKDIYLIERDGMLWVIARSGSVSTFSSPGVGKNWWQLPQGHIYPDTLYVVNDHGNHYNWEPNSDMPFYEYVAFLAEVALYFIKVR